MDRRPLPPTSTYPPAQNIKYGSYSQNSDFDDLSIEYEPFFTRLPIDRLDDNSLEILKVSLTKRSFYNIMYEINPQNAYFVDQPFD